MNLLGRHLTGLADFKGRENRQPFWLWVLIVYATQMVLGMVVMIPMMMGMFDGMAPMMNQDPDYLHKHPEVMNQVMAKTMGPLMQGWMVVSAGLALLMLALLAAAIVRRLHDGDRSGWWASPYFALSIAGPLTSAAVMPDFFKSFTVIRPDMSPAQAQAVMQPMMQSIMWVWLLGMIGFVVMILMIVLLALKGTEGSNRYGLDPLLVR